MTPEIKKALDLALEALELFSTPNWAGTGVDKVNAAIAAIRQARSAPVREPLHDEKVRLIAHNECPEDWDSLDNKEFWLKGFVSGFKTSEREYKE
jgi:hypothetical protein